MRIKEAAEILGVCPDTLRKWDRLGIIDSDRTPLGHRIFKPEDLLRIQKVIKTRSLEKGKKN